jgi:drug/metabolite transporter (DMT)-like permease
MKRAVRTLIQIIAAGLMIFGVLEIILEIAHHQVQVRDHVDPIQTNVWRYIIGGALLLVGVVLFAGSDSLAEQLTDDFDDGGDEQQSTEEIDE